MPAGVPPPNNPSSPRIATGLLVCIVATATFFAILVAITAYYLLRHRQLCRRRCCCVGRRSGGGGGGGGGRSDQGDQSGSLAARGIFISGPLPGPGYRRGELAGVPLRDRELASEQQWPGQGGSAPFRDRQTVGKPLPERQRAGEPLPARKKAGASRPPRPEASSSHQPPLQQSSSPLPSHPQGTTPPPLRQRTESPLPLPPSVAPTLPLLRLSSPFGAVATHRADQILLPKRYQPPPPFNNSSAVHNLNPPDLRTSTSHLRQTSDPSPYSDEGPSSAHFRQASDPWPPRADRPREVVNRNFARAISRREQHEPDVPIERMRKSAIERILLASEASSTAASVVGGDEENWRERGDMWSRDGRGGLGIGGWDYGMERGRRDVERGVAGERGIATGRGAAIGTETARGKETAGESGMSPEPKDPQPSLKAGNPNLPLATTTTITAGKPKHNPPDPSRPSHQTTTTTTTPRHHNPSPELNPPRPAIPAKPKLPPTTATTLPGAGTGTGTGAGAGSPRPLDPLPGNSSVGIATSSRAQRQGDVARQGGVSSRMYLAGLRRGEEAGRF